MPHAVNADDLQKQQDDAEIARLFSNDDYGRQDNDLDFLNRELEVGEKADDAEDFEDIGDDDLASEGEEGVESKDNDEDLKDFQNDTPVDINDEDNAVDNDDDDLFGDEGNLFTPIHDAEPHLRSAHNEPDHTRTVLSKKSSDSNIHQESGVGDLGSDDDGSLAGQDENETAEVAVEEDDDLEMDDVVALQRALFARAARRNSHEPPDAPETDMDLFFSIWPSYNPETSARFVELFPPVPGTFNWRVPLKPPKVLQLTKLNLEIAADTERSFRQVNSTTTKRNLLDPVLGQSNLVKAIAPETEVYDKDGEDVCADNDDDCDEVAGVSWADIELACCDWDVASSEDEAPTRRRKSPFAQDGFVTEIDDNQVDSDRSHKMHKTSVTDLDVSTTMPIFPSFDDPEAVTRRLGQQIALDSNDGEMLIDESLHNLNPRKRGQYAARGGNRDALTRDMTRRYNISNDEAYDLLKENHQHKVRSTLAHLTVEHSMPAVKLQYPFYKVKLETKQLRSFHRPQLSGIRINKAIRFSKPKNVKRKHLKGRDTRDIFAKAEDLSMGDNSGGLLLEYAEELPIMLSNFGMGNRLINYYRRKDDVDAARPKEEIGETQVLLPQDRSPFANFGFVDPGELVPAIQNSLCRAPIFKHAPRSSDFLVACSTTSEGNRFFIRNLENVHNVGQQLPLVEIPGKHSRKVTDAAKRRLKAISYRVWHRHVERKGPPLTNQIILTHLPGSDVAQNRGKMREFMKYDKINSTWSPKDGEIAPDNEQIRNMIGPEDVCLLDSMQAGVQHLSDLGLRRDDDLNDDDDDDKEGQNIEVQLAPWAITKNFLNATQGKAMLQLHGEGDPTGRGEGISFIKTSMKGGFRALGESIEERLDAKRLKENHGHSYNVARQQKAYDDSIRRIWRAQHDSLTSKAEHSAMERDRDIEDDNEDFASHAPTPRTSIGGPFSASRRDRDVESVSQFSRNSTNKKNQVLVITRLQDKFGEAEEVPITITNQKVIAAYKRAKYKMQTARIDPTNIQTTGDAVFDAMQIKL